MYIGGPAARAMGKEWVFSLQNTIQPLFKNEILNFEPVVMPSKII